MKTILWAYIIGAIVTKVAINNSPIDDNSLVIEWPLVWLKNPSGMLQLLQSRFSDAVASIPDPGGQVEHGNVIGFPSATIPPIGRRCNC